MFRTIVVAGTCNCLSSRGACRIAASTSRSSSSQDGSAPKPFLERTGVAIKFYNLRDVTPLMRMLLAKFMLT